MNISWLAGFYEGEGYPHYQLTLVLDVYQKDREVLDVIRNVFGGKVEPHNENLFRWRIGGKSAKTLAVVLLGYMHSPYKIEQLTRAMIMTDVLPSRSVEEAAEVVAHRKRIQALQAKYREEHREEYNLRSRERYYGGLQQERMRTRRWMREHPEEVAKVAGG